MLSQFSQRHPLVMVLITAVLACGVYPVMRMVLQDAHALPPVSAMAFLVASALYGMPMINSLLLEGRLRPDPPLWRLRFVLVMGYTWFVPYVILLATPFPSFKAAVALFVSAVIYGTLLLWFRVADHSTNLGEDQFDLTRPRWETTTGDRFLRWFPFVQWAVAAILVSVNIGGTAYALFLLILFHGPVLSYPLRNIGKGSAQDALAALALFCLLLGLFTGNEATF